MKLIKKITLYIFAIIGLLSIVKFSYDFVIYEKEANSYWNICNTIDLGITIDEANTPNEAFEIVKQMYRDEKLF